METNLFGFSWPLRHRVLPNDATRRWCRADGMAKAVPAVFNAVSGPLSVLGYFEAGPCCGCSRRAVRCSHRCRRSRDARILGGAGGTVCR
ncbi:hypothetical protein BZL29_5948 [Mycobacterium kansasii]|uniref:Uncharacterized protein n=1 Tax=Mycobacterium kansasii TaxID=1768 RepID=A0A1V3WWB6_MYCKA|nr:hypothetical protein BZL29_5948 [Mycobacterium kansasii]